MRIVPWLPALLAVVACSDRHPAVDDVEPVPSIEDGAARTAIDAGSDANCDSNATNCACEGQTPSCPYWVVDAGDCALDAVEAASCSACSFLRCEDMVVLLPGNCLDGCAAWAFDSATGALVADWGWSIGHSFCEGPTGFVMPDPSNCISLFAPDASADSGPDATEDAGPR